MNKKKTSIEVSRETAEEALYALHERDEYDIKRVEDAIKELKKALGVRVVK